MPEAPVPAVVIARASSGGRDAPFTIPELDATAGHLVRRAQQVHTAIWSEELDGHLTSPQYALVSALRNNPGLDQRTAGATASLDKSTTADVVARLERDGWVHRVQDPCDGRRKTLQLTKIAGAALNGVTPRVQNVQRRLLEPLPADEREEFVRLLARVAYAGDPPPIPRPDTQVVSVSTAPGHLVRRSEQVHGALWAARIDGLITPPQYAVLCAIAANDGVDQSTAGDIASLDKTSVAGVVRRLARRGWLLVEPDASDGRRKRLSLSAVATAMFDEVTPHVLAVQRELLAPLGEDEQRRLIGQLHAICYESAGSA